MTATAKSVIGLLLVAALLLSGCGYRLRGDIALPRDVRTVHVRAPAALGQDIRTLLESGGVALTPNRAEADASISVSDERYDKRVLSVDPTTGKEREFELAYTVSFVVTRRDGTKVIADGRVNLLRDFIFDPDEVLGKSREEDVLREEMRRDVAQQMMRQVEAAFEH